MALNAALSYSDGVFLLNLYPGDERERVYDAPPSPFFAPDSPLLLQSDAEHLEVGEQVPTGVKILGLDLVTERDVRALEAIPLPRVTCESAGIVDRSVADVVRWARDRFRGAEDFRAGWPSAAASIGSVT